MATQTLGAIEPDIDPDAARPAPVKGEAFGPVAVRALRRNAVPLGLLAAFIVYAILASHQHYQFLFSEVVAGLSTGAIASLSGIGLVLTYRATGVFNFAQGGVATAVAYAYFELNGRNGWAIVPAALVAVLVVAPIIGLVFELAVFRPLERRGGSTSEKLVANISCLVMLIAIPTLIFGQETFQPNSIWPSRTAFALGSVNVPWETLGDVLVVIGVGVGLTLLFRFTKLGTQIRAVVDRRTLAELNAVNANRVSQIAWVLGCTFAGMAGVLYAPSRGLGPGYITLAVLETIGVAVIARLRSIPAAAVAGLVIGVVGAVGQSVSSNEPKIVTNLFVEIFVVATVVFLMVYKNLDEIGTVGTTAALVTGSFGARDRSRSLPMAGIVIALLAAVAPTVLSVDNTHSLQKIIAYSVIFLSVVAITGYSGHISLATACFAGLGAYTSARIENGYLPWFTDWQPLPHVTPVVAMFIAALLLVPFGVAIGYPALRRKGLILALLTLAVAQVVDKLVFQEPLFTDRGLTPRRPTIGGWSFNGDKMFTLFELVILGFALLLTRNLRSGTLGRALGAMRDSENGATSVGISLRRYKLTIFGASAFLAALGGALLAQEARAVNLNTGGAFSPLYGLFWFTFVVVGGLSYRSGAVVAAVLFVLIDSIVGTDGAGLFVTGLIGTQIGWLPGGIVGTASRLTRGGILRRSLQKHLAAEAERQAQPPPGTGLEPSAYARELVGR